MLNNLQLLFSLLTHKNTNSQKWSTRSSKGYQMDNELSTSRVTFCNSRNEPMKIARVLASDNVWDSTEEVLTPCSHDKSLAPCLTALRKQKSAYSFCSVGKSMVETNANSKVLAASVHKNNRERPSERLWRTATIAKIEARVPGGSHMEYGIFILFLFINFISTEISSVSRCAI